MLPMTLRRSEKAAEVEVHNTFSCTAPWAEEESLAFWCCARKQLSSLRSLLSVWTPFSACCWDKDNLQIRVGLPKARSVPKAAPSHPHPESHPIHTDNFSPTSCPDFFFCVSNSPVSQASIGVGIHLAYLLQLSPNSSLQLLERNDGLRVKFICTNWNIQFGKELTATLEIPSCLCIAKGMSYE